MAILWVTMLAEASERCQKMLDVKATAKVVVVGSVLECWWKAAEDLPS
jgi:hypothetical protein